MIRRLLPPLLLLAVAVTLAACGEKQEPAPGATARERVTLLLDWLPNADHAPIYAAQASGAFERAGLDVRIQTPSDASSPLKVLAAGRADLAITYEPELLISRDKGQRLLGVGALIQRPLSSIISLKDKVRTPRDLAGKTVGVTGLPSDEAALRAVLDAANVPRARVKSVSVGFNLVPALLSKKADAILGAYWNVEAVELQRRHKDPTVIRLDDAGVPRYNELVFAAREPFIRERGAIIRRFMRALGQGAQLARDDPKAAVDALVAANKDLKADDQLAMVRKTLPVFFAAGDHPVGWMEPSEWARYGRWMYDNRLVRNQPDIPRTMTNEFLPGQGI